MGYLLKIMKVYYIYCWIYWSCCGSFKDFEFFVDKDYLCYWNCCDLSYWVL